MTSFEVTKIETPKTEPQKPRVKNSLIDSPHPFKNTFIVDPNIARHFTEKR